MNQNDMMAIFFGGVGGFAIVFALLNRLKKPKPPVAGPPATPRIVVDANDRRDDA